MEVDLTVVHLALNLGRNIAHPSAVFMKMFTNGFLDVVGYLQIQTMRRSFVKIKSHSLNAHVS